MAIYLKKPDLKRDWGSVTERLSLAALESFTLNIPNMFREIDGAITETMVDQTVDEIAWVWLRTSLCTALWMLHRQMHDRGSTDDVPVKEAIRTFADEALSYPDGMELTHAVMLNPAIVLAAPAALGSLESYVAKVVPDSTIEPDMLKKQFGIAIRAASARVLALDPGYYEPLRQAMSGPMSDGERQDHAWERHTNWIRHLFERRPIFSPDEEQEFPLAKVYQRLRCFWHEEVEEESGKSEDTDNHSDHKKTRKHVHVDDLHGVLSKWLIDVSVTVDPIRVVAGGPGSGKSSFARAFALEATESTPYRVVFVELQHLSFSGAFPQRLGEYLTSSARHNEHDPNGSPGFHENPLDWRVHSTDPILLVFDGLDELSAADDVAKELSRTFIHHVRHYLTTLNASGGAVRAIVLGRSAACKAALDEAGLHMETMIHVAPLKPLADRGDVGMEHHYYRGDGSDIHDPNDLRNIDQREEYWSRWATLTGYDLDTIPEAIKSAALGELNVEPLLLHLLIISGYTGENWRDAVDNRNRVYQAIFEKIFDRDIKKQHQGSTGLSIPQRFTVLECLGLAAWRGGGRTGDDQEFQSLIGRYAPGLRSKVTDADRLSLKNVAVQFYTRQGEGAGFEFIHKSFSEYLTARALLSFGFRSARQMSNEDHPAQPDVIAKDWVTLIDAAEMTDEVVRFLIDEARLPHHQSLLSDAKQRLTEVFNWALANGMPAHEADGGNFRQRETRQRCAETAVLSVLSAVARTKATRDGHAEGFSPDHLIDLAWPDKPKDDLAIQNGTTVSSGVLLTPRLMIQRLWSKPVPALRHSLCRVAMPGAWLPVLFLAEADLNGADLHRANLIGADLNGADLSDADLRRANMSRANLSDANMSRANLSGADLSGADLSGAHLNGADLNGARLSDADLNGAHLNGAHLHSANLNGADMSSTNLIGADLSDADMSSTNLGIAHLHRADLRRANLSGADLNGAYLNKADLIGANLTAANLTAAHLIGADLSGAYLNGADLIGANLSGADLRSANLNGAHLSGAHLNGADLSDADLRRADLSDADMSSANLSDAILTEVEHLTQGAVNSANGSKKTTKLPPDLTAPPHWDED